MLLKIKLDLPPEMAKCTTRSVKMNNNAVHNSRKTMSISPLDYVALGTSTHHVAWSQNLGDCWWQRLLLYIAHTLLIFKNNLDQLFIKTCVHFDLLVLLSSLTYHSIQNLCKINCTYSYVAWSMSLSVMEASAFNQKDAVDGMGVSLHVTCDVLTTGGTMILWESFIIFFAEWINYLCRFRNYVAFGTVSLFETLSHRNFWY